MALGLVRHFHPPPPLVLTDSLTSLHLIASWHRRPTSAILACADRQDVRAFLAFWSGHPSPPTLEKVRAHDLHAISARLPKALGNDRADALAKRAVTDPSAPAFVPDPRHADAVQLRDASGTWVPLLPLALADAWWELRRHAAAMRRPLLAHLYPPALRFDWPSSVGIFRRQFVVEGRFWHAVQPAVLKWVARARSGALATSERVARLRGLPIPPCPCCASGVEDDAHMVSGCTATGSADCRTFVARLWTDLTARHPPAAPSPPPPLWTGLKPT